MRSPRAIVLTLVVLCLVAPSAVAVVQDDAETGGDAPGAADLAIDVPTGTHSGTLDFANGDTQDWFRLTPPDCNGLRITFQSTNGFFFYGGLYTQAGSRLQSFSTQGSTMMFDVVETVVLLGLGNDMASAGAATYSFTVTPIDERDAGTICDAPDDAQGSVDIPLGTFSGTLHEERDDHADWFRVAPRACSGLQIVFRATAGRVTTTIDRDDLTGPVATGASTGSFVTLRVIGTGPFRIGLSDSSGSKVSYTFTLSNLQNDAASGCDAPDAASRAMNVTLTSERTGSIYGPEGDAQDWYRFAVPPCSILELQVHAFGGLLFAGIYSSDGSRLIAQTSTNGDDAYLVATGGPFLLGIGNNVDASYTFSGTIVTRSNAPACSATGAGVADPLHVA